MHQIDELKELFQNKQDIESGFGLIRALRRKRNILGALDVIKSMSSMNLSAFERARLGLYMSNVGLFEDAINALEPNIGAIESMSDQYIFQVYLSTSLYSHGLYHSARVIDEKLNDPTWVELHDKMLPAETKTWWRSHSDRLLQDQDIRGKRIVVVHDIGGVGDLFQFIRYVDSLKSEGAAEVYLHAGESLRTLLETKTSLTFTSEPSEHFEWDYYSPLFALFTRYQKSPFFPVWSAPYLAAPPSHPVSASLQNKLSFDHERPRVGLVWRSATTVKHEPFRSMSLETLVPLLRDRSVQWISLQVGPATAEELAIMQQFGVVDLCDDLKSFQDTAHALMAVDLLISIDSSPVHLAGALGRPAWVLLSQAPDHRWFADRRFTPWYPSVRLFRQTYLGQWDDVLIDLTEALAGVHNRC